MNNLGFIVPQGRRIGLLGGSFDPPHKGHVHITLQALKRFGLDEVWWLVSPGNPLKDRGPAALPLRMAACQQIMRHPRVRISDVEARIGTRFTAHTLGYLVERHPQARFVWLMGADNLATIHKWQDWRTIFARVPVGVLARPGNRMAARRSKAAAAMGRHRLPGDASELLPQAKPPAWCFINVAMQDISSTGLRAGGVWPSSP